MAETAKEIIYPICAACVMAETTAQVSKSGPGQGGQGVIRPSVHRAAGQGVMALPRNFNDVALVLSGGLGLGAYQAGAYDALVDDGRMQITRIAGSSVGAVNGALIAGTEAGDCLERLKEFWSAGDLWFRSATF